MGKENAVSATRWACAQAWSQRVGIWVAMNFRGGVYSSCQECGTGHWCLFSVQRLSEQAGLEGEGKNGVYPTIRGWREPAAST